MADDICDSERSSRIYVYDDSYTYDITIETISEICRRIWSEKLRMLVSEFVDESFGSTVDEIGLIKLLTTQVIILEDSIDVFEDIVIICL